MAPQGRESLQPVRSVRMHAVWHVDELSSPLKGQRFGRQGRGEGGRGRRGGEVIAGVHRSIWMAKQGQVSYTHCADCR